MLKSYQKLAPACVLAFSLMNSGCEADIGVSETSEGSGVSDLEADQESATKQAFSKIAEVSAGPDAHVSGVHLLEGDCGQTNVSCVWEQISGPGVISFSNPNFPKTFAEASVYGEYLIRLTMTDSFGNSKSDEVLIIWQALGAEIFGPNLIEGRENLVPNFSVEEAAEFSWEVVQGPGSITFSDASVLNPTISSDVDGTFELELTAKDSQGVASTKKVDAIFDKTPPDIVLVPQERDPMIQPSSYRTLDLDWDDVEGAVGYVVIGYKSGIDKKIQLARYAPTSISDTLVDGQTYNVGDLVGTLYEIKAIISESEYTYHLTYNSGSFGILISSFDRFKNYSEFSGVNLQHRLKIDGMIGIGDYLYGVFAKDGHYIMLGFRSIEVYDQGSIPALKESVHSPHASNSKISGNSLITCSYYGVFGIDITDVQNFAGIPSDISDSCSFLSVSGNYIYYEALGKLNVAEITSTGIKKSSSTSLASQNNISKMTIHGDRLFVSSGTDLEIFDLTDPGAPSSLSLTSLVACGNGLVVRSTYAYCAMGNTLAVIDYSDSSLPTISSTYVAPSNLYNLTLDTGHIYAGSASGILSLSLSDPASPSLVGTFESGTNFSGIYPSIIGSSLFFSRHADALVRKISIADPANLTPETFVVPKIVNADSMVAHNGHMIVGTYNGFRVFDLETPVTPKLVHVSNSQHDSFVIGPDNIGFAVSRNPGNLYVYDFTDPQNPSQIASIDTPGTADQAFLEGNRLYVSCGTGGLTIYDTTNAASGTLTQISNLTDGISRLHHFTKDGNRIYGNGINYQFYVIDVSDEVNPSVLSDQRLYEGFYRMNYDSGSAYVFVNGYLYAVGGSSFSGWDMTDPANPVNVYSSYYVNGYTTPDEVYYPFYRAHSVHYDGGLIYVSTENTGGVVVLDPSNGPKLEEKVETAYVSDMEFSLRYGNYLYGASRDEGIYVFDATGVVPSN